MLANILAFVFFAVAVTFIVLWVIKGKKNLKADLSSVFVEVANKTPGQNETAPKPKLTKQADCLADKWETSVNSDPIKMAAAIGAVCGGSKIYSSPTCSKYTSEITEVNILEWNILCGRDFQRDRISVTSL